MPLPNNITLITLTGQYLDFRGIAVDGQVKIYPSQVLIDAMADRIIIPRTITVDLVNGAFSLTVPVTNDPDVSPLNYFYLFEEAFQGGSSYIISLPASLGATVDITDLRADQTLVQFYQPIAYQLWPSVRTRTETVETFYSGGPTAIPAAGTYANLTLFFDTYATMASGWGTYANAVRTSLSFTTTRLQAILDRMARLNNFSATSTDLRDTTDGGTVTMGGYRALLAKYGTYNNLTNFFGQYNQITSQSYSWTFAQIGTLFNQLGLALNGQDIKNLTGLTDPLLSTTRPISGTDYGALTLTGLTNAQVASAYLTYNTLLVSSFSFNVRDWADRLRTNANRPHALLMKDYRYGINI